MTIKKVSFNSMYRKRQILIFVILSIFSSCATFDSGENTEEPPSIQKISKTENPYTALLEKVETQEKLVLQKIDQLEQEILELKKTRGDRKTQETTVIQQKEEILKELNNSLKELKDIAYQLSILQKEKED
jgi:TolA-binding protein